MIWKPKEEELTLEQAITLARKEFAPFWFGSSPLVVGIKKGNQRASAYPIDPVFNERPWLIFFIDPTSFTGQTALLYLQEWYNRYNDLNLGMLAIFKPPYNFFKDPGSIKDWINNNSIPCPVVVDLDGNLSEAFYAETLPKVILVRHGQVLIDRCGQHWMDNLELEIQNFLRNSDPGLPLFQLFQPVTTLPTDVAKMDFGRGRGVNFSAPGFNTHIGEFNFGEFTQTKPLEMNTDTFFLYGRWIQDNERIATSDPKAELSFKCHTSRLSVIAQSLSKISAPSELIVSTGGVSISDFCKGEHLSYDDEGKSYVNIGLGKIYHIFIKIPPEQRDVIFKFPRAASASIALYGLRFSE